MDKEVKTYLIIFGIFLVLATLVFFAGKTLGKRGANE